MRVPDIKIFNSDEWASKSASEIQLAVSETLRAKKTCSCLLTGGSSAKSLYQEWSKLPAFRAMNGVIFYLGDERIVPINHIDSNFNMINSSLFANNLDSNCQFISVDVNIRDADESAMEYSRILPTSFDIAIFSIGLDGHIASIFPGSELFEDAAAMVGVVNNKSTPYSRITISPNVVLSSKKIFLLVKGENKANILKKTLEGGFTTELPATLTLGGVWLLDSSVARKAHLI